MQSDAIRERGKVPTGTPTQSRALRGNHRHSETITLSGFIRHALSGFIGMHSVVSSACVRVLKVLILGREWPLEGGDVAIRHAASVIGAAGFTLACAGIARLRPLGARPIQKVAAGVMAPRERLDFGLVHLMREAIN